MGRGHLRLARFGVMIVDNSAGEDPDKAPIPHAELVTNEYPPK